MSSSGMWSCVDPALTDVSEERCLTQHLHSATSQKVTFFIITAVKPQILQFWKYLRVEDIPGEHSRVRIAEDGQNSASRGDNTDVQVVIRSIRMYFPGS
jgi:hypothetical protein